LKCPHCHNSKKDVGLQEIPNYAPNGFGQCKVLRIEVMNIIFDVWWWMGKTKGT